MNNSTKSHAMLASVREYLCDDETAVAVAARFVQEPHVFFLESQNSGPQSQARFSFIGVGCLFQVTLHRDANRLVYEGPNEIGGQSPDKSFMEQVEELSTRLQFEFDGPKCRLGQEFDLRSFVGMVGYVGFDYFEQIEPTVGKPPPVRTELPLGHFCFPEVLYVFDHFCNRVTRIFFESPSVENSGDIEDRLQFLRQGAQKWDDRWGEKVALQPLDAPLHGSFEAAPDWSSVDQQQFFANVDRALEEIRAGEIFQIQLGRRDEYHQDADPFTIFRYLRTINPSPYMFFYRNGQHVILGASPELMVSVEGSRMVHRPIAGTRKRSWSRDKDQRMIEELTTSVKERAEHVMLVDLSRNDLGRIANPGSVNVEDLMIVERYSHVFHMVSQVSAELRQDLTAADAMNWSFPNGTVVGAPKIRAAQLIYQYENVSREFYAGTLAMFSNNGDLRSTILIRSIQVSPKMVATHASAGIVYDSIPAEEWLEIRNKMAACHAAIRMTLHERKGCEDG